MAYVRSVTCPIGPRRVAASRNTPATSARGDGRGRRRHRGHGRTRSSLATTSAPCFGRRLGSIRVEVVGDRFPCRSSSVPDVDHVNILNAGSAPARHRRRQPEGSPAVRGDVVRPEHPADEGGGVDDTARHRQTVPALGADSGSTRSCGSVRQPSRREARQFYERAVRQALEPSIPRRLMVDAGPDALLICRLMAKIIDLDAQLPAQPDAPLVTQQGEACSVREGDVVCDVNSFTLASLLTGDAGVHRVPSPRRRRRAAWRRCAVRSPSSAASTPNGSPSITNALVEVMSSALPNRRPPPRARPPTGRPRGSQRPPPPRLGPLVSHADRRPVLRRRVGSHGELGRQRSCRTRSSSVS